MDNSKINKEYVMDECSPYNVLQELELERKRIARELHDSTIQTLTILIYKAEYCEKIVEKDTIRTKMELQLMIELLKESIADIRNSIYNLHPMSIEDLGLVDSIERYLILLNRDTNINFSLKVEGTEVQCYPIVNVSLYRIVQESCNNIIKHSKGTKACISVIYTEDYLYLKIQDDGIGFCNELNLHNKGNNPYCNSIFDQNINNGYGLTMMRERVNLLGGEFEISYAKDGTMIRVCIPLSSNKEENNG